MMAVRLASLAQPVALCSSRRAPLLRPVTWSAAPAAPRRPYRGRPYAKPLPVPCALACQHAAQLALFAFVSPVCFSQACQEATDRAFLIALCIPLLVAAIAAVRLLQPTAPLDKGAATGEGGREVFKDTATGAWFEAPQGMAPERDKNGELAFRALSYTPWPVEEGFQGERVRIAVGPVGATQPRTYVFAPSLPVPSDILAVSLPRPMGVVLQYDERFRRATVVDLVEGTAADQRRKMAALNPALARDAVLPGDVLRAITATNFVYTTRALFGAALPERHIVVYGADKQSWSAICGALKKGDTRDGEVTLVLERRRLRESQQPHTNALDIFA